MDSQKAPSVAVVSPVYNGEEYLVEMMDSVQAQTWPNLVHLVVENASTDGTAAILERYTNCRVPVVIVRNKELLPQRENWNHALRSLPKSTDWFRLLCADDTMTPDAVEKMVTLGESDRRIGVVGSDHLVNNRRQPGYWPADRSVFEGKEAIALSLGPQTPIIKAPHVLIRSVGRKSTEAFYTDHAIAFDTDAILRTLLDWKWGYVHEYLAMFREHETTVTSTQVQAKNSILNDWLKFLMAYGDAAFGADANAKTKKRYQRHYFWRLLRARLHDAPSEQWRFHMTALAEMGMRPGAMEFVDAAFDRLLIKLKARPNWLRYPW